jgi:hypothetical protein
VTPDQIARFQDAVTALDPQRTELAIAVRHRFTARVPGALRLLPDDDVQAGEAIIGQLKLLSDLLLDFTALREWAEGLGANTGTAVSALEMEAVGLGLRDAIADVLGSDFGADDWAAWRAATTLVTELMRTPGPV